MDNVKDIILDDNEENIDFESLSILEAEELKRAIYDELAEIDQKSVRALREGNKTLLDEYEIRAQELRTQLKGLLS